MTYGDVRDDQAHGVPFGGTYTVPQHSELYFRLYDADEETEEGDDEEEADESA